MRERCSRLTSENALSIESLCDNLPARQTVVGLTRLSSTLMGCVDRTLLASPHGCDGSIRPESDFSNWRLSEVRATTSSQWNLKLRIEILFLENFSIKYAKYDEYSGF